MDQRDVFDDTFTSWRDSYGQLRLLERKFVTEARSGKDLVRIAALYESVEAARVVTTALFQLAQTASMAHHVPNPRSAEISVW